MAKLDAYEQEILHAYETGRIKPIKKANLEKFKEAAKLTIAQDKRINIRLSSMDLKTLQAKALEEGLTYQNLITSVLHKYAGGRLQG